MVIVPIPLQLGYAPEPVHQGPAPSRIAPPLRIDYARGLVSLLQNCSREALGSHLRLCTLVLQPSGLSSRWPGCARNATLFRPSAHARLRPRPFGTREAESARRWRRRSSPSRSRYGAGARRGTVQAAGAVGRARHRGSAAPGNGGGGGARRGLGRL